MAKIRLYEVLAGSHETLAEEDAAGMSGTEIAAEQLPFIRVPDGATAEQVTAIQRAFGSEEIQNGIEWLVTHGPYDEQLTEDYKNRFGEVLTQNYGVSPTFHDFVINSLEHAFRHRERSHGQA